MDFNKHYIEQFITFVPLLLHHWLCRKFPVCSLVCFFFFFYITWCYDASLEDSFVLDVLEVIVLMVLMVVMVVALVYIPFILKCLLE